MSDDAQNIALALMTESVGSRFRCIASRDLSQSERNAAALLRLLAVLKQAGFEDDEYTVALRLADVTVEELAAYDLALKATGGIRWHRALAICAEALLQPLDASSQDDRVIQLLLRMERYGRLVHRLLFWTGDIVGDLERNLSRYLSSRHDVPDWLRKPDFVETRGVATASEATHFAGRDGDLFVFLLRDSDALAPAVDEWLHAQRRAGCFTTQSHSTIQTYPRQDERGWFHGMPPDLAIGRLRGVGERWIPKLEQLQGALLDAAIIKLAECYSWVLVKWPNTMQESVVAWISSDAGLADAWDGTLRRHGCQKELIATYRHLDSLQSRAGGAQFGESDGYGEAALVAAQCESWIPWLIVEADESSGHAWRRKTARLSVGAAAATRTHGWPVFVGVYRADELVAYRALWHDMDKDSGIVRATVCGRDDPAYVLDSFVSLGFRTGFRECNFLSRRHGWAYTHVYGGGADEHHAMFHAQDPAVTNRVVEYAAARPNWYLSGRW